jgi:hypothetical protein
MSPPKIQAGSVESFNYHGYNSLRARTGSHQRESLTVCCESKVDAEVAWLRVGTACLTGPIGATNRGSEHLLEMRIEGGRGS